MEGNINLLQINLLQTGEWAGSPLSVLTQARIGDRQPGIVQRSLAITSAPCSGFCPTPILARSTALISVLLATCCNNPTTSVISVAAQVFCKGSALGFGAGVGVGV